MSIPELALVVLIGPSGSGRSTFVKAHFKATEILSSDTCRGLVSDDGNDQVTTKDAFEVCIHWAAAKLTWHPPDPCLPRSGHLASRSNRQSNVAAADN
jgi:ABC-type phosphate transport system ATPase subunit